MNIIIMETGTERVMSQERNKSGQHNINDLVITKTWFAHKHMHKIQVRCSAEKKDTASEQT